MKKIAIYIPCFCMVIMVAGCANLDGLRFWNSHKYYQTELSKNIDKLDINEVGVYVFSEGSPKDATDIPSHWSDVPETILRLPFIILRAFNGSASLGADGTKTGVHPRFFPEEVVTGAVFNPDTSNAGPSLELGRAVKQQLTDRGYRVTVVTDLGHNKAISLRKCLKDARERGFDAIFIVNYTGINHWTRNAGTSTVTLNNNTTALLYNVEEFNGYLYLTNAGFFEVKKGRQLWKNSYYGLVENAHTINLASEAFQKSVEEALVDNGDKTYFKAAEKAAKIIFDPEYWPGSFKEFPSKGQKKRRFTSVETLEHDDD